MTFWCPSDILITSWLFTARWSTWPGNHLVPGTLVHPKDKVKDEEKTKLIYHVPCKNCSSSYFGETGRKFGLRIKEHKKEVDSFTPGTQTRASRAKRDRQEVWSEDQGTQESSGLFHSWYTDPSLTSQPSHTMPWKRMLCYSCYECHWLGQGKSGRQRGTATDQMDKRGTLDQEDTDVHESGCRIVPTQPHMGPGDFQVTCSIKL